MPASVKNKIRFGTIFLFILVVFSGGFSIFYLATVKTQSQNILKDNYESLEYAHRMQIALDSILGQKTSYVDSFYNQLKHQQNNITEKGEGAITKGLQISFQKLEQGDSSSVKDIRFYLQRILQLNMAEIKIKNANSQKSAQNGLTILITIVLLIFIVAFTFVINFPSVITSPVEKLTEGIREIANKNYSYRVHINSKDEFSELADSFNEMADRLGYFENSNLNKLTFEKRRAEAVINSLQDASIGIDEDDRILFANSEALKLLELKAEDIVNKTITEVGKKNDLFRFLLDFQKTSPFKIVVDGKENYFIKEVIDVQQGDSNYKVVVIKNITSFKELDVAKTNFIATVTHELKTPLASSDFSLKLLENKKTGNLNAEQKELLQNVKQDNQRILKILSELLNMSQVEAGRIQLNIQKVDPVVLVDKAIETVSSGAREKNILLLKNIPENFPDINADAEKTTWVLNNLLSNAIKYSYEGNKIEILLEKNESHVTFSVKDYGPGIDKKYQSRLFERYFQVPGAKAKGTGLGLAISKDFVEAQGGKIWVKSDVGEGSTFSFSLSLPKVAQEP